MRNIGLAFLLILFGFPRSLGANVLLFPNGGRAPGELGALMAGAQVALASGTEAAWYNPAGMAKEARTVLTAGGFGAELQEVRPGSGDGAYRPLPGFVSFSTSASPPASANRLSYGFFLYWPVDHSFSTSLTDARVIAQQDIPASLVGPVNLDALFPDGIERSEYTAGFGELLVLTTGAALGYEAFDGIRVGVSVHWEHLRFTESSQSSVVFSAGGTPADTGDLTGFRQTSVTLLGESERLVYTLGIQADIGRRFTMGFTHRLPSRSHKGNGSFRLAQSGGLQVVDSGTVVSDAQEFSQIAEDGLPFVLRQPGESRLGLAWQLESFTVEVDWIRSRRLGSYQVFPTVSSDSASTRALQIDSLNTSLDAANRYALGLGFSVGENGSLLFGYARDRSAVAADDTLFRKVDLNTLSGGYYFTRGGFSGSAGLAYRSGEAPSTPFPRVDGDTTLKGDVSVKSYSMLLGGSYIF